MQIYKWNCRNQDIFNAVNPVSSAENTGIYMDVLVCWTFTWVSFPFRLWSRSRLCFGCFPPLTLWFFLLLLAICRFVVRSLFSSASLWFLQSFLPSIVFRHPCIVAAIPFCALHQTLVSHSPLPPSLHRRPTQPAMPACTGANYRPGPLKAQTADDSDMLQRLIDLPSAI